MHLSSPCSRWAKKLALRMDDLSATDQAELLTHLEECSACRALQDEYHSVSVAIQRLPRIHPSAELLSTLVPVSRSEARKEKSFVLVHGLRSIFATLVALFGCMIEKGESVLSTVAGSLWRGKLMLRFCRRFLVYIFNNFLFANYLLRVLNLCLPPAFPRILRCIRSHSFPKQENMVDKLYAHLTPTQTSISSSMKVYSWREKSPASYIEEGPLDNVQQQFDALDTAGGPVDHEHPPDVLKGVKTVGEQCIDILAENKPASVLEEARSIVEQEETRRVRYSLPKKKEYLIQEHSKYPILSSLSEGAFGCIYLINYSIHAAHIVAAMKLFRCSLASHPAQIQFLQEAQFLQRLRHPHILPVLDFGIDNERPYLISEYSFNDSLRDHLRRYDKHPLPMEKCLSIIGQIGQALEYAHDHKIVHADIKPENILFNASNDVLLADFGIAIVRQKTKLTGMFEPPPYMAPEVFEGLVSEKSDQYALACIAYELLTGRLPEIVTQKKGESEQWQNPGNQGAETLMLDRIREDQRQKAEQSYLTAQHNSHLPKEVEFVILRALAKNSNDRYQDVRSFVKALFTAIYTCQQGTRVSWIASPLLTGRRPGVEITRISHRWKKEGDTLDMFICYNGEDKSVVKKIGIPLEERSMVSCCDSEMMTENIWKHILPKQISSIKVVVICVGEQGIDPWQCQEPDDLLKGFLRRGYSAVSVLLPNAPRESGLPNFLPTMKCIDFRTKDTGPIGWLFCSLEQGGVHISTE